MKPPMLLAVPNVSEGRDGDALALIGAAFAGAGEPRARGEGEPGVRVLDVHTDADHHRTVFTLAGAPGALADALVRGARAASELVDVMAREHAPAQVRGEHPYVGAVDVAPIVHVSERDTGAACAEALVLGDRLAHELGIPVFLYGELTADGTTPARTRAQLRRGGIAALAARMAGADGAALVPDFGGPRMHERAGATLVAARAPLVAFNLQLASGASVADARAIAADIREGGAGGLPGLRAIGVELAGGVAQVSMNVERPRELALARIVEAVRLRARVASAELVGLAPAAAFAGFPADVPIPGFDPARHLLENALDSLAAGPPII